MLRDVRDLMGRAALWPGLLLVSTAGPFLVATGLETTTLVVHRLGGSGLVFLAWAAATGALRLPREHLARTIFGGALLAAHFLLWIKAFDLTDYASNLLLLVAQPVIAAVLGTRLGERPTRGTWLSVSLALAGLLLIAGGDFALGPKALAGDLLSVLGSAAITVFYAATRRARAVMPLPAFMGWTMTIGALVALPFALVSGATLLPTSAASWGWLAGLVVLSTVAGHGLMNLAARHVRLFTLNVVIVLEPAIGIGLGAALFDASVSTLQVTGGLVLAAAVLVGLGPERRLRRAQVTAPAG